VQKKIKSKGFTLVELLVAVSIIGVISLIAIPAINGVIENKNKGIYEKYGESLVSSAKLYADSYDVDLFGQHPSGCMQVDLETLKKKNLIKDVSIKNSNCNTEDTYVIVKKVNGKYQYQQQLKCKDSRDDDLLYEDKITVPICTEESSHSGPDIKLEKPKEGWVTTDKAYVAITLEDIDGMLENNEVKYMWSKDEAGTNIVFEKKLNFGNDLNDKVTTKKISRPKEDGKFYLIVQPIHVVDVFGNYTTKKEVKGVYKFDSHAPTCETGVTLLSASKSQNTWTNQNVDFKFKFSDEVAAYEWITYKDNEKNESSDNLRDKDTNVIATEKSLKSSGVRTYTIKIRDEAGNTSTCKAEKDYWIDKNEPTCTITPDEEDEWYKEAVELQIKPKDDLSGVASSNITTSTTPTYLNNKTAQQSADTKGQKWYGYVKDNAGNVGECSTSVKVDKTKPTCEIIISEGTTGDNGWYRSDVKLSLITKDDTSDIGKKYDLTKSSSATYEGASTGIQTNDTTGKAWYGYVKDKAGNTGKCTKTIKKDTKKPTCSVDLEGTKGNNEWYKSNVKVTLNFSDNSSGIAGKHLTTSTTASYGGTESSTQTTDTSGTAWYGYVKDTAGNVNTCNVSVKKDATKPNCSISADGTKGDNDWYKSNVDVTLSQSDSGSGVKTKGLAIEANPTNGKTSDTQTANTTRIWYGRVEDNAGNVNTCQKEVKKDANAPLCEISISSGTKGNNGWYKSNIGLKMDTTENVSGLASKGLATSSGSTNGNTTGTQKSDTTGTTWYGYVKDKAGNTNSCSKKVYKDTVAPTLVEKVSYDSGKCKSFYGKALTTNVITHRIKVIFEDETSGITDVFYKYEYNDSTPDAAYITDDSLYLSRSNTIILTRTANGYFKKIRQDYNLTTNADAWFKFKLVDRAGNSRVTNPQKANFDGSASSANSSKYCRQVYPTPDSYKTLRSNYNKSASGCSDSLKTYCYLKPDDSGK